MKANQKILFKNDNQAQVGIGTLIIFIAMVLVAAVAAAVLIQTSGTLQQKAQATGEEAIEEVSSNMMVKSVEGSRDATTDAEIENLYLQVALSAGGADVDLGQLILTINDGENSTTLNATALTIEAIRDADSSYSASSQVMNDNDLMNITLDNSADLANINLDPRTDVKMVLIPESGTSVNLEFTTPSTYALDKRISLYP